MAAQPRTFFRVVKTDPPRLEDFVSNDAKGLTPPDERAETLRVWSGISVYATAAQARRMARRYTGHGDYIAVLRITDDSTIRVERTLNRPGHHTLWAPPAELLESVIAVEPL